ncbi:hypothetical protein KEM54_000528 [Ascosphaera aggregata]|nr:hypothetical protein KEM54_000528 [Ascosphaera aggregata]
MAPGLLWVSMQPREGLPVDEFHDWYNNEHGPTCVRLPFVENGFGLRAIDLDKKPEGKTFEEWPEWLSVYDISEMSELQGEVYLRLRRDYMKSQRGKDVVSRVKVDRRLFDFVEEVKSDNWAPLETFLDAPREDGLVRFVNCVVVTLQPGQEDNFHKWYREEHMPMMTKIPGFLRIRRFRTSSIGANASNPTQWLSVIEWDKNPTGTPELAAMNSTPWREKAQAEYVAGRNFRAYKHYYTFGPAPRDLASLHNAKDIAALGGTTKVMPLTVCGTATDDLKTYPAIESYITTADGVVMHYRLEGSSNPHAPLILLSNCILADYSIWDDFLERFFARDDNRKKYRVVRYLMRGRTANVGSSGSQQITVDTLASDIIAILDALRVEKAAALIGVSLGGATVLHTALKFPDRVHTFIACDTNPAAPPNNPEAWDKRISLAKSSNAVCATEPKEAIVGYDLADVTVKRWFVPSNYETSPNKERAQKIAEMVANNSLVGFEAVAKALYVYDLRAAMKRSQINGAFVVGDQDGILFHDMKEMAGMMGGKSKYYIVDNAGHLPMVEQPAAFEEIVNRFLKVQNHTIKTDT